MQDDLLSLLSARKGHFALESGHHGGMWMDLDPLFVAPSRIRPFVAVLADKLSKHNVDALCGPLVGGAFLAQAIATLLGVEFYYAERFVPAVRDTLYPIEYRIPPGVGKLLGGKAVAVVDDAVSAGSAARGTIATLEKYGAKPVAIGALLVLGDSAAHFCAERGLGLESIAQLPYQVWLPAECPMCTARVPLEDVVTA
ncbi:MAG: orotate phosphoribosyltransferase [Chloroflexia bacterium]